MGPAWPEPDHRPYWSGLDIAYEPTRYPAGTAWSEEANICPSGAFDTALAGVGAASQFVRHSLRQEVGKGRLDGRPERA